MMHFMRLVNMSSQTEPFWCVRRNRKMYLAILYPEAQKKPLLWSS